MYFYKDDIDFCVNCVFNGFALPINEYIDFSKKF